MPKRGRRQQYESMNDYLFFETDHFTVSQVSGYRVPGYVIVQSKVDCTRLADFDERY